VGEGAANERGLVDELELDLLGTVAGRPSREPVGERALLVGEHADPVATPLVEQGVHLRPAIHRDQHQRRPERDGHERVRRHAVHLVVVLRGDDRDAGGEHPKRPAERGGGVLAGLPRDLQLLGVRRLTRERLPDPDGRESAVHRQVEFQRR
jgi:hypothetical protein